MSIPKRKIINDPVHGFITVEHPLIFKIIGHPYYQRLRRIYQMALAHLVYPGAVHTRLHHSLGAYHLMCLAINELKNKGAVITPEEEVAAKAAILLHDIGHGPFSHALEHVLVPSVHHEELSLEIMHVMNKEFNGQLDLTIQLFTGKHDKEFLHQLISSQLDVDRMDYLTRDSFFTGVSEGVIGYDRILKMFAVHDNQLMIEEKGIYSVEKFLVARRQMYWQVYLHKTVVSAEQLLAKILKRARELALKGKPLFATPALDHFLANTINKDDFMQSEVHLEIFTRLDDNDIMAAVKVWENCDDFILSSLCRMLMRRHLYHIDITNDVPDAALLEKLSAKALGQYPISHEELDYFVFTDTIKNNAYKPGDGSILILMKDGKLQDIAQASDNSNLEALARTVKKYIICYAKELI